MDLYMTIFKQHPLIFIGLSAVLGLLIGSFLNVVAIRIPLRQSIVYPPSRCPHCQHRLGALDLVPVLSYLALRGRCRYCRAPVSSVYAIGEAVTALLFAGMAWHFGPTGEWIVALLFVSILIVITQTDLRHMLIPDRIVAFAIVSAILLRLVIHPLPLWNYGAAMIAGSGLLYLIAWLSLVVANKEGMGGGDIKLYAFIGLILGLRLTLLSIFTASLLGTLIGVLLIGIGKFNRDKPIPFGPFIALGSLMTYLWGDKWIQLYIQWLTHS